LLETTEAEVIIDMMGQVLVVVEAARTGTDQVQEAVKRISPDKVVGMILNKSRASKTGGYYGGYYGYDRKNEYT
jgi:receptor protein-tyrosine kinase